MAGSRSGATNESGSSGRVRLAIVNDYEVIVAGVRAILAPFQGRLSVVELDVETDPEERVDVALFDVYGQPGLGIARLRSLVACDNVGAVAVYTWSLNDASRRAAIQTGARGLIAKSVSAERLADAVAAVAGGAVVDTGGFRGGGHGAWPGSNWNLTAKESEVLAFLATGMPNQSIAESLFVSENTVRTHLKSVFRKMSVTNRSQAVAKALVDPGFATRHRHVYDSE